MARMVHVKMPDGRTFDIPDIWLAGFCREGRSVADAIAWWIYQDDLERQDPR